MVYAITWFLLYLSDIGSVLHVEVGLTAVGAGDADLEVFVREGEVRVGEPNDAAVQTVLDFLQARAADREIDHVGVVRDEENLAGGLYHLCLIGYVLRVNGSADALVRFFIEAVLFHVAELAIGVAAGAGMMF